MRRWIGSGLALGLASCVAPAPEFDVVTCGTSDVTFTLDANGFAPSTATVKYAGEVQWQNTDTVDRTVQDGEDGDEEAGLGFDSGTIAPGQSFCVEAREIGDTPFFADGGAAGVLTVEPPENTGGGDDTGYDPPMGY